MGGEILRAALDTGILAPSRVGLLDPDPARIETFASLGCHPVGVPEAAAAPRLLLAVKPQVFPEVAAALRHASTPAPGTNPRASSGVTPPGNAPSRLAISVMAGLRSTRIAESLGPGTAVVRTMPNTPSAIRLGMTAIAPGPGATPDDLDWVRSLFTAVGGVVELDESHFHAVTAVSGSGPAWVFRMAEAWIAAAVAEGLPPETAERLVIETMFGAASLLRLGDRSPSELRTAVTSRGGTTAAGLAALDATGFDDAVQAAITAATARGRELDA
jgi:pyrroline-5-carboxylate reductase